MDRPPREDDRFAASLGPVLELAGVRRTARLPGGVVRGIVGGERLVCSRIAALSPGAGHKPAR